MQRREFPKKRAQLLKGIYSKEKGLLPMQRYAIVFFIVLGFLMNLFAEESFSRKKLEELTQFLKKHQEDFQEVKKLDDELFESRDASQELSALLNDQEMPSLLQAYYFLLVSYSPEFWENITTAEETAQVYLKFLKHRNPIIRLHGLSILREIKELLEKPKEWLSADDILKRKKLIGIIEAEYSPPAQDQKLFEEYKKCFVYLRPILSRQKNINVDVPSLMAVFETADPAVQFYLTFRVSWITMWSGEEQLKSILLQLGNKGDNYTKGLVATSIMDMEQVRQLLKNSTNPDEFITLGEFLNSRNVIIPLDVWPDRERLQALFDKASCYTRYQMLKLIKNTIEFSEMDME